MNAQSTSHTQQIRPILSLINQGRCADAEALCKAACIENPDSAELRHLLAIIYAQTQQRIEAKALFQHAIELAPKRADFWGNYANLLLDLDEWEEAVKAGQQSLLLNPHRPEAHNTLGNALLKLDRLEPAADCYRQALQLDGAFLEALYNLALTYKALLRYVDAERCFKQLLAQNADFGEARKHLREVDSCWLQPVYGKRLYLQRFAESDGDYLDACYHNQDFMYLYNRFQPVYPKARLRELLIKEAAQHPMQNQSISWLILERQTERPIGLASLVAVQLKHERAELLLGIPEPKDRLFNAAVESMLLLLDFAFNRIALNKLTTAVYSDNLSAQDNNLAGQFFINESYQRQHYRDPNSQQLVDFYGNALFRADFCGNARLGKISERVLGRNICA